MRGPSRLCVSVSNTHACVSDTDVGVAITCVSVPYTHVRVSYTRAGVSNTFVSVQVDTSEMVFLKAICNDAGAFSFVCKCV